MNKKTMLVVLMTLVMLAGCLPPPTPRQEQLVSIDSDTWVLKCVEMTGAEPYWCRQLASWTKDEWSKKTP